MQPNAVTDVLRKALEHQQAGRLGDAEALYLQVVRDHGNDFETLSLLALLYLQAGLADRAEMALARAWPLPESCDANSLRRAGIAWRRLGQTERAGAAYERMLATDPTNVDAMVIVAEGHLRAGRVEAAIEWLRRAVERRPSVEILTDLGAALQRLGRVDEAEAVYRRGLQLNDRFGPAHSGLGVVLAARDRMEEAFAEQQLAVTLSPPFPPAYVRLADVARVLGRLDEATAAAERAVAMTPSDPEAHRASALALSDRGLAGAAADAFRTAASLMDARAASSPVAAQERDMLRVAGNTVLPQVYDSEADVRQWRDRLAQSLAGLARDGTRIAADRVPPWGLFHLAYQGHDDRELMRAYAGLFAVPSDVASGAARPARGTRIRVGFVSRHFAYHTIGRLNVGIIERLDREQFEVVLFSVGEHVDPMAERFRRAADQYVVLPPTLPAAREAVRSHAPDILLYTDLGMDPFTYTLAHTRLAPVQCTTWGHPVTSGIAAMDYFVSSALIESAESQAHYTERLALLPRLSVYYDRATLSGGNKGRQELNLPSDANLYGCLQSVWKFHPEFDALLAAILRRDPTGVLLVARVPNDDIRAQLWARWSRSMPDVLDRVRIQPKLRLDDFLSVTRHCAAVLDPIHFGGGNTSYEAFSLGVPVVTWPSPYLRGRLTLAMYRAMGVMDCVATSAEQYVELAVRLATDTAYRQDVSRRILAAGDELFEDERAVRGIEEFFRSVATKRAIKASPFAR